MDIDSFEQACDRLSKAVDAVQFERLRFARVEAPMLARMVELALGAVESREDFDLVEENSTKDVKAFVLKVHGKRIARVDLSLDKARAVVTIVAIERSPYRLAAGGPISADYDVIDEAWMAETLEALFSRIAATASGGSEASETNACGDTGKRED